MTASVLTVPGPRFTGWWNKLQFLRLLDRDLIGALGRWYAEYGDTFAVYLDDDAYVFIRHPDDLHTVLVGAADRFIKDAQYRDAKAGVARFLGNGLVTSDGEFWRRQRKLSAPAFHARRIEAYAGQMVAETAALLAGWHDGAQRDLSEDFGALTMRIVSRALFGAEVGAQAERIHAAVVAMQHYFSHNSPLPTWVPTRRELSARRSKRDLDAIVYDIIGRRRASPDPDRGDLLAMLLAARDDEGQPMTEQQLRDEVVTLFLAGHETTSNTLVWTFHALSQNPEVEAQLVAEVAQVLGSGAAARLPTLADLERLPYTARVIKESQRLLPVVFGIGRESIAPVTLRAAEIPPGTSVQLSIYHTHHDPRWYPHPERFDPDRFLPAREAELPKMAYLPFGGGPRICIGNNFALMEARLILVTIVSRFSLRPVPGAQVAHLLGLTLTPRHGMPMRVTERPAVPAGAPDPDQVAAS
jgi:cytochrome P450